MSDKKEKQDQHIREIKRRLAHLRASQFEQQVERSLQEINLLLVNKTAKKQEIRNSAFIVF